MKKPIDTTASLHHQIATLILVKKSGPRKLPGRPVEPRARCLIFRSWPNHSVVESSWSK